MNKIKILVCLLLTVGTLSASEYNTNKKYSYTEVAEILSEKIIEDRERILNLEREVQELKNQIKSNDATTQKKLNDMNKTIVQKPMSEIREPQFKAVSKKTNDNSQEISNATIKNIEISTELYKKVQ